MKFFFSFSLDLVSAELNFEINLLSGAMIY